MENSLTKRKTNLFIVLAGLFITNAIVAEIVGVKIFSAEKTFGFSPAQIPLFGDWKLDFDLTAGVLLWPVVFITTDLINEYFGKPGVKKISYLTAGLISYMFVILTIVTALAPANFWLDVNATDDAGAPFDIDFAFTKIFTQSIGIIIGSLFAFLLGQLVDSFIFQRLRKLTGSRYIWLRATGSTLISQFIDSYVVLGIAFKLFGTWSWLQLLSVGTLNYMYKFGVAILLTPIIYAAHHFIDRYLGKKDAAEMADEATAKSDGFF